MNHKKRPCMQLSYHWKQLWQPLNSSVTKDSHISTISSLQHYHVLISWGYQKHTETIIPHNQVLFLHRLGYNKIISGNFLNMNITFLCCNPQYMVIYVLSGVTNRLQRRLTFQVVWSRLHISFSMMSYGDLKLIPNHDSQWNRITTGTPLGASISQCGSSGIPVYLWLQWSSIVVCPVASQCTYRIWFGGH